MKINDIKINSRARAIYFPVCKNTVTIDETRTIIEGKTIVVVDLDENKNIVGIEVLY